MNRSLTIVYASTSGHTEYVVDVLMDVLANKDKNLRVIKQRAERTTPEDMLKADILLLATSSWNTGNVEGQLNPYMHDLLMVRAAQLDLAGKPLAVIGLGDDRYFFLAKAADRLTEYVNTHRGQLLLPALKIVNEPYGQEDKIQLWSSELLVKIDTIPMTAHS